MMEDGWEHTVPRKYTKTTENNEHDSSRVASCLLAEELDINHLRLKNVLD